jgi:hypothetical protein
MFSLIRACGTGLDGGSTVRLGLKELSPSGLQSFLSNDKNRCKQRPDFLVVATRLNPAELKLAR